MVCSWGKNLHQFSGSLIESLAPSSHLPISLTAQIGKFKAQQLRSIAMLSTTFDVNFNELNTLLCLPGIWADLQPPAT